ncbi:LPXTG-motif cell wall-anchored protein [Mumia flava]|uniref:LPXTG-motif cell wall-anchored protein n=1 Tax=Mumia flava TaxID=1348852 RepID=A0A2M9BFL3_9ACTN|nr:LPXTG cell wall anchor domain-containing protein [Mumia flava]PJJ56746.1 LPXTG-motif cell wall-anchored protein [Mumia flava]
MRKILGVALAAALCVAFQVNAPAQADDEESGPAAATQQASSSSADETEKDDPAKGEEPKDEVKDEPEAETPEDEPSKGEEPAEEVEEPSKGEEPKDEPKKGEEPKDEPSKDDPPKGEDPKDEPKKDDPPKKDPPPKGSPEVTPTAPTVTQSVCKGKGDPTPADIELPADTDEISYTLETADGQPASAPFAPGDYVVTATPNTSGSTPYVLVDPLPAGWTLAGNGVDALYEITLDVPKGCKDEVTPPAPEWIDDCGPGNGYWEFTDTDEYEYTVTENEDGSVTVTVSPKGDYQFPEGTVTEWTETDSEEECILEVPPAPVWTDNCEIIGSWDVPPDGEHYRFEVSAVFGGASTVTLIADEGYAFPEGTVTEWTETEDAADCALLPGDIESQCVSAVPYLSYAVELPPGFAEPGPNPVTITFVNPSGPDYVVSGQPLSGQLLWPGASATPPLQWPGWELLPDGTYVETDGNFAWTRQGITVRFDVNPTYSTTVEYPQESSTCANPQNREVPPDEDEPDNPNGPDNPTIPTGYTLPNTGAGSPVLGLLGAMFVLVGGSVLLLSRRRFSLR